VKSLKDEGVPLSGRVMFRVQYAGKILALIGLVMTLPAVCIWALAHDSGVRFLQGITAVLEGWVESIKAHRQRVIDLYAGEKS
jgi:hypothetical protein